MSGASIELSVVVPLFEEAENIPELIPTCLAALRALELPFELILVDDGSGDETARLIREASNREQEVEAIALRRRFGKGAALAAGLARAQGQRIVTIDGDLQEDPNELALLLEALDDGYDLVTGWRRDRQDPWPKRLQSIVFNRLVRSLTPLRLKDLNCGFKVMTPAVARELVLTGGRFRFVPLLAAWWGFRVTERAVSHRPRKRGRSSYGGNRFPGSLIDLIAVLFLIRYHSRPGHLFIQSGALTFLLGGGVCGYLAWLRLSDGSIGFRYPLLALGVLLIVIGVQLTATGFLGEWLAYGRRDSEPGYRVLWSTLERDEAGPSRER